MMTSLVLFLSVSQSPQNSHRPLAPRPILLIFEGINVEQPPSRLEKPVDFLPTSGFQVVPRKFDDIQLPQRQRLKHTSRQTGIFLVILSSLRHTLLQSSRAFFVHHMGYKTL